jgi:hypothetical protein
MLFFAVEDEDVEKDKWFSDTTRATDNKARASEEDRVVEI